MAILVVVLVLVTGIIGALLLVFFLARKEGALTERLNNFQKDADYSKKQAEELLKDLNKNDVAGSLDRGEF